MDKEKDNADLPEKGGSGELPGEGEGEDGLFYRREGKFWKRTRAGFACPACDRPVWMKMNEAGKEFSCESCGSRVAAPVPALGKPAVVLEEGAGAAKSSSRGKVELPSPKPEIDEEEEWADVEQTALEKKEIVAGGKTPESAFGAEEVVREEWEEAFATDALREPREELASTILKFGAALLAIAIAVVVVYQISNMWQGDAQEIPKPDSDSVIPVIVTGEDLADIAAALDNYFLSESVEDKARTVRHPEETLPRMVKYFGSETVPAGRYEIVEGMATWEISADPYLIALIDVGGGKRRSVAFERAEEGLKLDWESFVGYSPMKWGEYVSSRPAGPMEFRLKATPDDYYNFEFTGPDKFHCLRLTDLEQSEYCYGYMETTHPDAARIMEVVEKAMEAGSPTASLLLRLEYSPESRGQRQVKIVELIHDNWLLR